MWTGHSLQRWKAAATLEGNQSTLAGSPDFLTNEQLGLTGLVGTTLDDGTYETLRQVCLCEEACNVVG
jgi:hypothetical protein